MMNEGPYHGDAPLFGLVLAGGESRRMGEEKALIRYGGEPQVARAAALLREVCDDVYVSARAEQRRVSQAAGVELIPDQFAGIGPAAGVLSAMRAHPDAAWFVLACDMPRVDDTTVTLLARERGPSCYATAFVNAEGRIEPLCAIYEPKAGPLLEESVRTGNTSLRAWLENAPIRRVAAPNAETFLSVNSPAERADAMAKLSKAGATP
ncbi:MAG: NTP transferase domain-containing protein [Candidatus Hydrogenedentota bacterium]